MKSFIQGFLAVALLFAGSMTAEAQINYRADVDIPFEFSVAGKTHEAGRYTIKINRQMAVGAALMIQRIGSDDVQTILLGLGGGERSRDVQLIFSSIDGRKYLTGVNTATTGFELVSGKTLENRLARSKPQRKRNSAEF